MTVERGGAAATLQIIIPRAQFGGVIDALSPQGNNGFEGNGISTGGGVNPPGTIRRIALIGNHIPRQCGIATFTTDLADALTASHPELDCFVLAMNDAGQRHSYPARVRFELAQGDLASYRRAADFLNVNPVDVVCLQHEYGIFGGKAGAHILALLRELRMPIVATLHTILASPDALQRAVMDELTRLAERIIVMSEHGAKLLRDVYQVPEAKLALIPHGIPPIPSARNSKRQLGVQGKRVILTFGLLSPDKGIEYMIEAMPAIVARYPDTVYIVLGATHPHVREHQGETYRLSLQNRAQKLGVAGSMIFHNRFVSQSELAEFLSAADVYITPYLKLDQITSGTLAYAVGSGKAVVSTPYWYASEVLADGRGVVVPVRDSTAIARAVLELFDDPAKAQDIRERAASYGRGMVWPAVADKYVEAFARAHIENAARMRTDFQARTLASRPAELPEINLEHLRRLTDDTGILRHARFNTPRYDDGYCLDDNAQALLLMTLLEESGAEGVREASALGSRYLAFVSHAFSRGSGRFRDSMSYTREWLQDCGSDDSHGVALWALGTVVGRTGDPGGRSLALGLFQLALPAIVRLTSPRSWAFALLGIDEYLRAYQGDSSVESARRTLAERLLSRHRESSSPEWPWFEEGLTYSNARLSQALLVSGSRTGDEEMIRVGLQSLEWLSGIQKTGDGYFAPIGTKGFYMRGAAKAQFDQQPLEACVMVSACMEARRATGDARWAEQARVAFDWFLGQNQLHQSPYEPRTGGCRDGLLEDRVNENQGAESTLAFLLALLEMRSADRTLNGTNPEGKEMR